MIFIPITALSSFVLSLLITFIYTLIYKIFINKRLVDHERIKIKFISPNKFLIITFIILFLILTTSVMLFNASTNKVTVEEGITLQSETSFYTDEEIQETLLKEYSHEKDIPGYSRSEKEKDSIRMILYRNENGDTTFPDMIFYFEYPNNKRIKIKFSENSSSDAYRCDKNSSGIWVVRQNTPNNDFTVKCYIYQNDTANEEFNDMDREETNSKCEKSIDFGKF